MVGHSWRDRLIVLSPVLLAGLLLVARPGSNGPTLCPYALLTGMACPGCGMTRAGHLLLLGDVPGALGYHPVSPLIAFLLVSGWVWYMLWRVGRAKPISPRLLNTILLGVGVILVVVWLVRWSNGTLPPV